MMFYFGVNYGHYPLDSTKTQLTSKELIYRDDDFRKIANITYYHGDKEILKETEYLSFNEKKDSKYKSIEVGAFNRFFGLFIYTEQKIDGKFDNNMKLVCYTYDGQLIGTYEPLARNFGSYTHQELKDFISMIESEISKQEETQM